MDNKTAGYIRVSRDVHRRLKILSATTGTPMGELVEHACWEIYGDDAGFDRAARPTVTVEDRSGAL